MSEDYWDGAIWVFHGDITNDGANSGTHQYDIIPGAGNEFEVLYGTIRNLDASARAGNLYVNDADGGNIIGRVLGLDSGVNLGAGRGQTFPASPIYDFTNGGAGTYARFHLAGTMSLNGQIASVAVSQDTTFAVACRIRGGLPTVVFTSPTDAVEVTNTNQVY